MSAEFAGSVALVTGAGGGIGLATAQLLARRGARVLLGSRSAERLQPVLDTLRAEGLDVAAFIADVTVPEQVAAAFAAAREAGDVPDVLVNNVGARDRRGVDELDTEAFSRLVQADLVSAYDVTRGFLAAHASNSGAHADNPATVTGETAPASETTPAGETAAQAEPATSGSGKQRGAIVTVSSLAAHRGRAGDVGYAAAKAGLDGMTRSLASELGPRGYRVNAVAPGMVATEVNASLAEDPRFKQLIGERTPLRRWAAPEEIAEAICFLASPRASYITGVSLLVDGGFSHLF